MKKIPDPKRMRRVHGPRLTAAAVKTAKVRITTYLDRPVIEVLRQLAQESGSKYQSILNQTLRDYLLGEKRGLMTRLTRLEQAVFPASTRTGRHPRRKQRTTMRKGLTRPRHNAMPPRRSAD